MNVSHGHFYLPSDPSGHSSTPLHLPPKGLPSQPPQPRQSSAVHRSLLLLFLLSSTPPLPQPEPDLYTGFLYSLIHSSNPSHRLFIRFPGIHTSDLVVLLLGHTPSLSDIDLSFSRHSWFSLGHSSPLHLTGVSSMSEARSGAGWDLGQEMKLAVVS